MKIIVTVAKKIIGHLIPPYYRRDLPVIVLTLLILIGLPIMVFISRQSNQNKIHAQSIDIKVVEPETGIFSGNATVINDTNAAEQKYVRLRKNTTTAGVKYYIDCNAGSDTNDGRTETTAWKTLSKASAVSLQPGEGMLLKRGCVFSNQTLTASWTGTTTNNVIVSAYGSGEMPIIESNVNNARLINITGSYITIDGVYARAVAVSKESGCSNNPTGYIIAFQFDSSSHHNTLQNAKATGAYAGVYIKSGSNNNNILNNTLQDNVMMNPLDVNGGGDAGAFGVLLHGDANQIAYNTMSGHDACSYDYGRDGSDVEIYGGSRNIIHHNIASQSDHFSELGKDSSKSSSDNVYAYNKFTSNLTDSVFLNTRGEGHNYGPIYNTKVYNNSVYLTGSQSQGIVCSNCGSNILTLKNNILWADWKAIYASTSFVESNNIYWKTGGNPLVQGFTMNSTSKQADPKYVSSSTRDLHLQSNSPAINVGTGESITAGFTFDLDKKSVNNPPEIGAYEL